MTLVTSTANPTVRSARKLVRGRPRRSEAAFLVEGPEPVRAALPWLRRLFVTADGEAAAPDIVAAAAAAEVDIVRVTDRVLGHLATTVTPQGLAGVAAMPRPALAGALARAHLVVVLWEARDPGNVGSIIRTADAGGADAVVLAGHAVDPRNPKAVRSSAGSLFHMPVVDGVGWDDVVRACRDQGLQLVAAHPRAACAHVDADLARPTALVFGSESHGLSESVRATCDAVVSVPLLGQAESLNLGATVAVLVYEAARQRMQADATRKRGPR